MNRKPVLSISVALTLLVAAVFGGAAPAHASPQGLSLMVNSTADAVDAVPGDGICSTTALPIWPTCTLRAAIMEANAYSGADTISLPTAAGPYLLTLAGAGENAGLTGDLDITENLTLAGGWNMPTVDGNGAATGDRVFQIASGVTVSISNVKIKGGQLGAGSGGGIYNQGALSLSNVTVEGNVALGSFNGGGGIYNTGSLTLTDSLVNNNTCSPDATCSGGGVYNSAQLTVLGSTLSNNGDFYPGVYSAPAKGGGLFNAVGANGTLQDSTVRENRAVLAGGGIYNFGTLTLLNVTVSGNSVYPDSSDGGGIYNFGTLNLVNTTVSGNLAHSDGGGIYNLGTARLYNATVLNNVADFDSVGQGGGIYNEAGAYFSLRNTLVAYNSIFNDNYYTASDCYGVLTFSGYNLLRVNNHCSGYTGSDQVGTLGSPVDPKVDGTLKDNGGPTKTHALYVFSPAIDGGNPVACTDPDGAALAVDQRSFSRVVYGGIFGQGAPRCDIGAFEYGATAQAEFQVFLPVVFN